MENVIEEITEGGITAKIIQDPDPQTPSDQENGECFLIYNHRQFNVQVKGFDGQEIFEHWIRTKGKLFKTWESVNGKPIDVYYHTFPVYAYIHSGVSLSLGRNSYPFTDQWDTSFKGFVLVKRTKGWSWTKSKAEKIAQSVVDEWNQYLSSDVYGYVIEDKDGEHLDSCWGFYGLDYAKSEANSMLRYHIGQAFKARTEKVKTFIRNRVPLHVRQEQLTA